MRRMAIVLSLVLAPLAALVFAGGTVLAADPTSQVARPVGGAPVQLASTGFDITVPVVVGLSMLVVGIGLISWAFLRGGSDRTRSVLPTRSG